MSRLAQLIAKEEGYGKPGAIPTTHNNPGDLRHSPHSDHDVASPDAIGRIDTPEHGWQDLERQLHLYADRGLTLREMIIDYYAPPGENDSERYLKFVCDGLGVDPSCTVAQALALG
jgi:hypothetical protein